MLIPLGHEQTSVRRLPWVTFAIMGLCLVVFLLTFPGEKERLQRAFESLNEGWEYFQQHPYLEMDDRLLVQIVREFGEEGATSVIDLMRQTGPRPPADDEQLQEEQDIFDAMMDASSERLDASPLRRLGAIPSDLEIWSLITYQFIHFGWGHLFGNLFILFLAGPFIEDVWGRPLYASFYLTAGVVAALMFVVRYPDLNDPLGGASGAIAGVMGAFLIRYWNSKIRFLYWVYVRFGSFEAPAWLMLPLWFLKELLFASAADVVARDEGGGGVAFWAHVWGFVFGVAAASAIAYFRVEDRFIDRAIESKVTLVDNTVLEDAAKLAEEGDREAAKAVLEKELVGHPDNVDAAIALWNLSFQDGQVASAAPHLLRAIRDAARRGDDQFVTTHWLEILDSDFDTQVEPALGARIAEMLRTGPRLDAATKTVELAARGVESSTPPGVLLRLARSAMDLDSPQAAALAAAALTHPDLPPEAREELEAVAGSAATSSDESEAAGDEDEVEEKPMVHFIVAKRVVPRSLRGQTLEVDLDGHRRSIDLATVQVIAVSGIARAAQKPVVLVDLLLDSPWGDQPRLRVIRMTSDTFDPRAVVGGDDALGALKKLLVRMLEISEAVPLPDPDAARGNPFRSFSTIEAYEKEILGVG
jgi:membrane associated rhomboid family serine protease